MQAKWRLTEYGFDSCLERSSKNSFAGLSSSHRSGQGFSFTKQISSSGTSAGSPAALFLFIENLISDWFVFNIDPISCLAISVSSFDLSAETRFRPIFVSVSSWHGAGKPTATMSTCSGQTESGVSEIGFEIHTWMKSELHSCMISLEPSVLNLYRATGFSSRMIGSHSQKSFLSWSSSFWNASSWKICPPSHESILSSRCNRSRIRIDFWSSIWFIEFASQGRLSNESTIVSVSCVGFFISWLSVPFAPESLLSFVSSDVAPTCACSSDERFSELDKLESFLTSCFGHSADKTDWISILLSTRATLPRALEASMCACKES